MLETEIKVRVKSKEEISKTLDVDSTCGTIFFNNAMYAFCGQTLTLTTYLSSEAYSVKETFYTWRPEWFDVIDECDVFKDGIWEETLSTQMLNLAMLHQVESGNSLNRLLLKQSIDNDINFPAAQAQGFSYCNYPSEKWKYSHWCCDNPPKYKWLNLKSEIIEKIILAASNQNSLHKLIDYPDEPMKWFMWTDTIEGSKYWSEFNKKYTLNTQTLINITKNERNQIKLQRKKTSIRVGTVPEGCRVHGKGCKASVRCRHLSYSARVGY